MPTSLAPTDGYQVASIFSASTATEGMHVVVPQYANGAAHRDGLSLCSVTAVAGTSASDSMDTPLRDDIQAMPSVISDQLLAIDTTRLRDNMQAGTNLSTEYAKMSAHPENQIRVLIVDDDPQICEMLARFLSEHGLIVAQTGGREEFLRLLERDPYDIVVLDIMLSGGGGISLCRKVRASSTIPIILLSAANAETDRIVGLEVGADDCLAKPFNQRELLARIRAILRRMALAADSASHPSCYRFDGWTMDMRRRTLSDPFGTWIELTSNEFDLLAVFVQRPQTVLSRDHLLDLVHGRVSSQLDRSIDVQISRLRRKIEAGARSSHFIRTMRSEGYIFVVDVERTIR